MRTVCYLDMDDVLADFRAQAYQYVNYDCNQFKNKKRDEMTPEEKAIQQKLFHHCDFTNDFWSKMPVKEGGRELYEFCREHFDDVILLSSFRPPETAPYRLTTTFLLKLKWAHQHLGSDDHLPKVIVTPRPKSLFVESRPDFKQVLIDDMVSNVEGWKSVGGIGILHTDTEQTMAQLQALLQPKNTINPLLRHSQNQGR